MQDNPSYYSILTADVRYDKRLKANEKIIFSEISALTQATGLCWASNNYFAELYEVDSMTISRWINRLIKLEYLEVRYMYKEGTKEIDKRMLKIKTRGIDEIIYTPSTKKSIPPRQKDLGGIDEKVKGNITSINNTSNNKQPLPQEIQTDEYAYSKIFDIWQQEIGQITSMVAQDVKKDIEDMKKFTTQQDAIELIEYAISEAAMNSARTPSYVFAITRKICVQQLKTVADVKARKLERQTKRDKQKFKPAKRVVEKKPNYPTQPTPVEQTVPAIKTPVDATEIESTRKAIERLKASRMPKGE
ncbi:helix-turn-helix domain-containing protein [Periweissella ghanensis]|uniref:DnaB/C C-terminal domain-containing protein n=1 Tax=Periweissella ghanensis TaxID=467997 RepID=A0ABN8BT12_9LACO|nr:helix-turn-helix domain-containing protein [Periweissella ghanensis]MCM0601319.1 helix-turn-helix domain-containing protein [Periweissella ghanensis]CAH0419392.1 hypothetical protein WGH24286_01842 [Periweissella ghanensis]